VKIAKIQPVRIDYCDWARKGPSPLVGESDVSPKSELSPKYISGIINLYMYILKKIIVKISASQVWLGNYTPSHLISSYIYVAVGHILAGIIKTINYILISCKLVFRRDYN
jgi:hypothetical protein